MTSTVAPDPWPAAAQYCPRCQRAIPGGIRHAAPGWIIPGPLALTDAELLRLCPLDTPSAPAHSERERPVADLVKEVAALAESLRADGEASWAKMLDSALLHDSEAERLTYMGHGVALLLERGPQHWWRGRSDNDRRRVRQLLCDIVVKWPPREG